MARSQIPSISTDRQQSLIRLCCISGFGVVLSSAAPNRFHTIVRTEPWLSPTSCDVSLYVNRNQMTVSILWHLPRLLALQVAQTVFGLNLLSVYLGGGEKNKETVYLYTEDSKRIYFPLIHWRIFLEYDLLTIFENPSLYAGVLYLCRKDGHCWSNCRVLRDVI